MWPPSLANARDWTAHARSGIQCANQWATESPNCYVTIKTMKYSRGGHCEGHSAWISTLGQKPFTFRKLQEAESNPEWSRKHQNKHDQPSLLFNVRAFVWYPWVVEKKLIISQLYWKVMWPIPPLKKIPVCGRSGLKQRRLSEKLRFKTFISPHIFNERHGSKHSLKPPLHTPHAVWPQNDIHAPVKEESGKPGATSHAIWPDFRPFPITLASKIFV